MNKAQVWFVLGGVAVFILMAVIALTSGGDDDF